MKRKNKNSESLAAFVKKRKLAGFTIIELVVVCAIIALLSTVIFVGLNNSKAKSRDARRVSEIDQIKNAFVMYNEDHDGFPAISGYTAGNYMYNKSGGTATYSALTTAMSPYLSPIPIDPKDGVDQRYYVNIKSDQTGAFIKNKLENSTTKMTNDACGTLDDNFYDVAVGDYNLGDDSAGSGGNRCTGTSPSG